MTFAEFSFPYDDFHIDGLFCICEPLLIEVSTNIHGQFQIESVRRVISDDHAVDVPAFISDFVGSWALTAAGKAVLRKASDEHQNQRCRVSEIAAMRADDLRDQRAA